MITLEPKNTKLLFPFSNKIEQNDYLPTYPYFYHEKDSTGVLIPLH